MKILCRLNALVALASAAVLFALPAGAAQQRSFVASTGLDSNACNLPAPCRTFGAAIAQTLPGGEVIVLDSAGYGAATIAAPVSIISPPGIYAGISVFAGTGITVNPGSGDVVVLRGLSINNISAGVNGIDVQGGLRVMIDRCAISGFSTGAGIALTTSGQTDLDVTETLVRDSAVGVQLATSGILSQVTLSNVRIESSPFGVDVSGSSVFLRLIDSTITNGNGDAIHINPLANRTVRFDVQRGAIIGNNVAVNAAPFNANVKVLGVINDALVAENGSSGIYAVAGGAGSIVNLSVTNSVIRYNGTGLRSQIAGATILSKNNLITDNGFDIQAVGAGAAMLTGLGNTLFNNGTPGAFTGTVVTQ